MSNLLDRASILLTPTSVSQHRIHSVKPIQTFGSELITNGSYDADSNWQGSGGYPNNGWAISNGVANFDTNVGDGNFSQGSVHTVGKQYVLDCDAEITSGRLKYESPAGIDASVGGQSAAEIFSGKNRIYYTAENTSAIFRRFNTPAVGFIDNVSIRETIDGDFDFTRATTATRVNSSGLIESVASGLPRIDFLGGTGQILLEPASTNTATYSNDFTQGDIFSGSSDPDLTVGILTANQGTAPDGTNTASLFKDNSGGGSGQTGLNYFSVNVVSDNFNTVSIFVKKSLGNNFIYMQTAGYDSGTFDRSWFDIQNGTLGTTSSEHTTKIEDYGSGWFRCSTTFKTTTDLVGSFRIFLASADNTTSITRDGTNGVLLFGLQAEADASRNFATSYIPTSGSTVTRNKDEANSAGDTSLISSTQGVLYAEIAALANDETVRRISITDGTVNNRVEIAYFAASNRINVAVKVSGSDTFSSSSTAYDITQFNKIAVKYKVDDFNLFINGVEISTDTSGAVPAGLDTLNFDSGSGSFDFEGKVKSVAVYKEALDNDELECLTGSGFDSFTALAEAGSYTII